jgi:hypothetical protein
MPTENIPGNKRDSVSPVFRTLAHVKSTVRLIAPDTSFIDLDGSGHGGDVDDKSGGKASTYAWKDALLKGLSIPHEDMVDTDDDSSTGGYEPAKGRAVRGARQEEGSGYEDERPVGRGASKARMAKDDSADGNMESALSMVAAGVRGGEIEASDEKGLSYVLAKIKASKSVADLEQIRSAIKSGVLALHGADRLAATKAFVERKKELDA